MRLAGLPLNAVTKLHTHIYGLQFRFKQYCVALRPFVAESGNQRSEITWAATMPQQPLVDSSTKLRPAPAEEGRLPRLLLKVGTTFPTAATRCASLEVLATDTTDAPGSVSDRQPAVADSWGHPVCGWSRPPRRRRSELPCTPVGVRLEALRP